MWNRTVASYKKRQGQTFDCRLAEDPGQFSLLIGEDQVTTEVHALNQLI